MRKTIILAVALVFGTVFLTGCVDEQESAEKAKPVEISYRGGTLHCLTWEGSHSEVGMTCDFNRFYNENPMLK